jgi:hypothetical protein
MLLNETLVANCQAILTGPETQSKTGFDSADLSLSCWRSAKIPGQADGVEQADEGPSGINFSGRQTVTGRRRKRVMVVVPAFTVSQQRYPPAVSG